LPQRLAASNRRSSSLPRATALTSGVERGNALLRRFEQANQ